MKKSFLVQIIFSFVLISLLGDNIFAQKSLTKDVLKLTSSIGKTTETINLNPLADCTGPGQMIFDDGTFENGVGWLNTVTDGRYVSLFTPPAYPWQFNSLCLPLTRTGTTTDFTFDIVVYDGTGGGTPGTLVTTIPGVTAAGVPSYPSFTFYSFDISSVPQLVSGSYYIGIKYNPSVYQNFYSMDDESITTPLHPAYGYANTTWNAIETLFTSARALGYRTLGPSLGPGLATNPNPVNFASGVTITNLNLSWTNPGGATSNKVYFGTDPNNMSLIHSGSLVSSVNAPTPLNYSTFYFWRVDEISGITTTYGTQWCFTTAAAPCGVYATPFIENFELADFPPLCWTLVAGGSYNWIRSTACSGY